MPPPNGSGVIFVIVLLIVLMYVPSLKRAVKASGKNCGAAHENRFQERAMRIVVRNAL